ncbi:hypothetical protein [Chryseobacterium gambrini]|uniref:hypothetical protein n=1 Tax=Chryseobacterium gambrini TaxID=373672 RepID=UPI003D095F6F
MKDLYSEFKDSFTVEEIKSLLNLEEEIDRDTSLSNGKRLTVNYVAFNGKKEDDGNQNIDKVEIDYKQEIYSGVNIWVADNLKGKSSIFKIIKFALTGSDSLKPNISRWIDQILVVFSINYKKYTVFINNSKRVNAILYNKEIKSFPSENEHLEDQLFVSSSKTDFENQIQNFFFRQLDYYSLRWTQKSSVKDKNDLLDVGASWLTYFKSVFLESKDSAELMYGSQGTKVFQMLLGLHLTSPINKLTVQKDMLMHEKGKQNANDSAQNESASEERSTLQKELDDVTKELDDLNLTQKESGDIEFLVNQYDAILKEIEVENNKSFKVKADLQENRTQKLNVTRLIQSLDEEKIKLDKENRKVERQQIDIQEYLDIGVLFSNLEIKSCPSCNHPVTNEKKQHAVNSHSCALCNDDVSKDEIEFNTDNLSSKLDSLVLLNENIKQRIAEIKLDLGKARTTDNDLYSNQIRLEQQLSSIKDIAGLNEKLKELHEKINLERQKMVPRDSAKDILIEKKAILKFRIDQLNQGPKRIGDPKIEQKIQLLTKAVEELNSRRFSDGQSILKKLSDLMLSEVQSLGLRISEITINDKFDIKYKQDGDYLSFSQIAEGEQLRAKLAFYLSLIQLDIIHNYGRHSRFLIIDSPGKEEGDRSYLEGLTSLIKEIEERYGDQLQILIGTAERSLENTVSHQNIFPVNTYVF